MSHWTWEHLNHSQVHFCLRTLQGKKNIEATLEEKKTITRYGLELLLLLLLTSLTKLLSTATTTTTALTAATAAATATATTMAAS